MEMIARVPLDGLVPKKGAFMEFVRNDLRQIVNDIKSETKRFKSISEEIADLRDRFHKAKTYLKRFELLDMLMTKQNRVRTFNG